MNDAERRKHLRQLAQLEGCCSPGMEGVVLHVPREAISYALATITEQEKQIAELESEHACEWRVKCGLQDQRIMELQDRIRRVCLTGIWGDGGVGSGSPSPLGPEADCLEHVQRMERAIASERERIARLEAKVRTLRGVLGAIVNLQELNSVPIPRIHQAQVIARNALEQTE